MGRAQKEGEECTFDVTAREPKSNKMFDEWQHAITKFLTFSRPVKCAHCGKKRKRHWTQMTFFRVMEETGFTLSKSEAVYAPLTPVCSDHILAEDIIQVRQGTR